MRRREPIGWPSFGSMFSSSKGLELNKIIEARNLGDRVDIDDSIVMGIFDESGIDGQKHKINYFMKKLIYRLNRVNK
jgi:hypothetical protein